MISLKYKVVAIHQLDELDNQMTEWLIVQAFNGLLVSSESGKYSEMLSIYQDNKHWRLYRKLNNYRVSFGLKELILAETDQDEVVRLRCHLMTLLTLEKFPNMTMDFKTTYHVGASLL